VSATKYIVFYQDGPQVTEEQYGSEPTLREMVEHYYKSHDCQDWKKLAREYMDKWSERYDVSAVASSIMENDLKETV